ncbi:MAG TPA: DUF6317 family protein [Streptosporangiaceae bacterium]|nr:DUF6317 family protein [Streptosporangiaceae bacterium]
MSGGGFQVVMSDLQSAASTFHSEAATFQAIMPNACTSLPDGGSGAFNESLNAVVETLTLAHMQIGADIDDNGTKLQTAHDKYQHTEESLTQLAQQISDPAKIH